MSKFIKRFIVSMSLVLMVSLSVNLSAVEASTLRATTNLNVRSGAGTRYRKVTSIKNGSNIETLAKTRVGSTNWYKLKHNGRTGWASGTYLTSKGISSKPNTNTSNISNYTTPLRATTNLNVRSGPGTKYSRITSIPNGVTVKTHNKQRIASVNWYKITHNGKTGWASGAYLTSKVSSSKYKANHIYINGSGMPMKTASYSGLQSAVDNTRNTWVGFENYNPSDNRGTYFAQHRNTGGGVVLNLKKGNTIIATDSNGNPQTYTVTKLLYNQTKMTDEICGWLEKEYIVLQTSEHRINGNRQGNRIVIADKK